MKWNKGKHITYKIKIMKPNHLIMSKIDVDYRDMLIIQIIKY